LTGEFAIQGQRVPRHQYLLKRTAARKFESCLRRVHRVFRVTEDALIREMDSLAPARSALRPPVSPNSFRRFLDEPTGGLDPIARNAVWNQLVRLRDIRVLIVEYTDIPPARRPVDTRRRIVTVSGKFAYLPVNFHMNWRMKIQNFLEQRRHHFRANVNFFDGVKAKPVRTHDYVLAIYY